MELALLVYVVETLIPGLNFVLGVGLIISAFVAIICTVLILSHQQHGEVVTMPFSFKFVKGVALYLFLPFLVLNVIVPSKKSTYFIVAGYFTQSIVESDGVNSILTSGNETVKLFIERTNEQLKSDIDKIKMNDDDKN